MNMKPIFFFVDGEPRAKQSFRISGSGGFTPARIKAWQSDVGWAAQQAIRKIEMMEPTEENLTVEIIFFLGNLRRIDLDNLSKAVQDGLNKITWKDDQQNIRLVLDKYVCREKQGVLVVIKPNPRAVEITVGEMESVIGKKYVEVFGYDLEPFTEMLS